MASAEAPASPTCVWEGELGHVQQRARGQPRHQPLHAVGAGCWLDDHQPLELWQREQRAQQRQLVRGQACANPGELRRLAQQPAGPTSRLLVEHMAGRHMLNLQLLALLQRRRPQLFADAAQGYGDARVEHVAQHEEDDAQFVIAQLGQRELLSLCRHQHDHETNARSAGSQSGSSTGSFLTPGFGGWRDVRQIVARYSRASSKVHDIWLTHDIA